MSKGASPKGRCGPLAEAFQLPDFTPGTRVMLQRCVILIAVPLILTGTGCGPSELTPKEKALAAAYLDEAKQRDTDDSVARFTGVSIKTIVALEAIHESDITDFDAAVTAVKLFDEASNNIRFIERAGEDGRTLIKPEVQESKADLKAVLIRKQKELFPAIRNAYAAYMSDAVVGAQANFRAVGTRNRTLRGASPSFGSEAAVAESHQLLLGNATRFRFDKAVYVYDLDGRSFSYSVNGKSDDELR